MKKLILAVFALCCMTASAEDYNKFLEVGCTNGTTKGFPLETLRKITFDNGNMVVSDTENTQETFSLAEVEKLSFTRWLTGVGNVTADSRVTDIYTIDGRRLPGTRPEMLNSGIYIIRRADGTTTKITR